MKIRINPLDQLTSKIVRLRAKGKCQRCGQVREMKQLQAAHCFGRANKKVRHDLDNILALDFYCHQLVDSDPEEKRNLWIRQIGKTAYENLNKRANWPSLQKPDLKAIRMYLEQELKSLKQ